MNDIHERILCIRAFFQPGYLSLHGFFRRIVSPYGDYNNTVIEAASSLGYHSIQWDVDSLDWKDYGVESIIQTVTGHKHLGNGSIILCHNGAKYTAKALDSLLTSLEEKGYQVVPVSQLIYTDHYQMDVEGRQFEIKN